MDENGTWTVSPAYDLTFSTGPGGEHCTMIMGNGRNPGTTDLLKLAAMIGINKQKASLIINQVKDAISRWNEFAKEANVSHQSSKNIERSIILKTAGEFLSKNR